MHFGTDIPYGMSAPHCATLPIMSASKVSGTTPLLTAQAALRARQCRALVITNNEQVLLAAIIRAA